MERTKHITKRFIAVFLLVGFFAPMYVHAQTPPVAEAILSLTPTSGKIGVGKTLVVSVVVESSVAYNSASAKITFDKELLSVQSVSKSNSALSLWAVEPSFDNTKGTVDLEGGNTTAVTGKKTILTVTFKGLKEGNAKVEFTSASVLAADGKGTDISGAKNGAEFEVSASAPEPPAPPATPIPDPGLLGPKPEAPDVTATTHLDEKLYYNSPKAKFIWELPPDVTVVRVAFDTKPETVPTTSYDPAINEKEYDTLTDGVMYGHVRYKNDAGWGPTTHRKILVDRTAPEPFTLAISVPASTTDAVLTFSATDTTSGIDRYEIVIDGGNAIKIPLSEIKDGGYTLTAQAPGEHQVTVKAYDKAGNYTPVDGKFKIEGETPEEIAARIAREAELEPKPTDWNLVANIGLVAFIAFLIGYLWYERKSFRREKYNAKKEADELRDNLANIFSALREEVGEQTGMLFQKPNPSAKDREVMVHINEAIDLSEELISKEAEDVRKLLM